MLWRGVGRRFFARRVRPMDARRESIDREGREPGVMAVLREQHPSGAELVRGFSRRLFSQPLEIKDLEEKQARRLNIPFEQCTQQEYSPSFRRCGLIARKAGMVQEFARSGELLPLTVLEVDNCQVVQIKGQEKDGYVGLQLGCGTKKLKRTTQPLQGHFACSGVGCKSKVAEFRVSPEAYLPVGFTFNAMHFQPGQYVDVTGTSKGKGTAGVMKRWNFSGGRASHGASLSHRSAGSIGQCQDPGKVFKGKKMAGRMGNQRVTVQGLWVYRVDPIKNQILVLGAVPGNKKGWVLIKDSVKKVPSKPLPFPSFLPTEETIVLKEADLVANVPTTGPTF